MRIGHWHDPLRRGADSRALLRHVVAIVAEKGWKVGNVDATIVAQAPKMAPHIETMRGSIAEDLGVAVDQVNVKATTTERLVSPDAKRALLYMRSLC